GKVKERLEHSHNHHNRRNLHLRRRARVDRGVSGGGGKVSTGDVECLVLNVKWPRTFCIQHSPFAIQHSSSPWIVSTNSKPASRSCPTAPACTCTRTPRER